MAILNVPSAFATPALANAAAIAGDTILIEPGTYLEAASLNFIPDITISGNGGNPSAVVLSNNTATTVNMTAAGNRFFSNLTIANGILPAGAATDACLNGNTAARIFADDVIFASAGGVTCVQQTRSGGIFNRCKFTIPFTATVTSLDGFRSVGSQPCTLSACVFIGFTGVGLNAYSSTAINCSAYEAMTGGVNPSIGIYCGNVHNCAVWGPNITTYGARSYGVGNTAGYSSIFVTAPVTSLYVSTGSTSDGFNYGAADIIADGNPLFANPPTNMEPHADGLAFQNGNNAYALPTTDYAGNAWNNPPSRGAYEYVASGGGAALDQMDKINNMNNCNDLQI